MISGIVKWYNTAKGYGFIATETGAKEIFVHVNALQQSGLAALADNQRVRFDIKEGRDGRESAINLHVE